VRCPSAAMATTHETYKEPAIIHEKSDKLHSEYAADEEGKAIAKVDYSGSHEKTDPKEIALVKKLDRWIMPYVFVPASSPVLLGRGTSFYPSRSPCSRIARECPKPMLTTSTGHFGACTGSTTSTVTPSL
jgi:hypothetical protein